MNEDILLVDDDPGSIGLMARMLADLGSLRFASSGADGLRLARAAVPDLVLLDTEMPGMTGFETCRALKADTTTADVPVIFVTSHRESAFEVAGFEVGAADFIAKPVSAPLLRARVKTQLRVKHLADELRRMATIDPLTGVANRRRFDESLEREWRRGQRTGDALALLMIDVDHFKLFNDRYGHPAGDACLRRVVQALGRTIGRPGDLVARYGGEEFMVLLPQTPRHGAAHVARDILGAVAELDIVHEASLTTSHVTVSVGIACYDEASERGPGAADAGARVGLRARHPALDMVKVADSGLYAAKRAGRDRAWLLDLADADHPELARDIGSPSTGPAAPARDALAPDAVAPAPWKE